MQLHVYSASFLLTLVHLTHPFFNTATVYTLHHVHPYHSPARSPLCHLVTSNGSLYFESPDPWQRRLRQKQLCERRSKMILNFVQTVSAVHALYLSQSRCFNSAFPIDVECTPAVELKGHNLINYIIMRLAKYQCSISLSTLRGKSWMIGPIASWCGGHWQDCIEDIGIARQLGNNHMVGHMSKLWHY